MSLTTEEIKKILWQAWGDQEKIFSAIFKLAFDSAASRAQQYVRNDPISALDALSHLENPKEHTHLNEHWSKIIELATRKPRPSVDRDIPKRALRGYATYHLFIHSLNLTDSKAEDAVYAFGVFSRNLGHLLGGVDGLSKSSIARLGAEGKLKNDPKQVAKKEAEQYWKNHRSSYKTKADFARAMQDKFPQLTNAKVIEGWCRDWDGQSAGSVAIPQAK